MENETILVEKKDHIGTLIFNRPEKRNSLTPGMLIKVYEALKKFSEDDTIRAVVFKGAGDKAFCAGYDIGALPTNVTPQVEQLLKTKSPVELAMDSVKNFPYPTIAMMNGYTFGAGFNLAICCDIRIAVDDIRMGMPPVKLGVVYHPDGLRQFLDTLGMARTREVFMTAHTYSGSETKDKGLVNYLLPGPELESFTYGLAREITQNAPLAVKGTKKILNMFTYSLTLSEAELEESGKMISEALNSDDLKEGQMAFFEKRKPKFVGR